jgi:hypothetical protein
VFGCLSLISQLAKHNASQFNCSSVKLVWCARTPDIFELFRDTFEKVGHDSLGGRFEVRGMTTTCLSRSE